MRVLLMFLALASTANADIVREINFPGTPASIGPYSASFDRAGFLVDVSETQVFDSISSTFGNGQSAIVTLEVFQGAPSTTTGTNHLPSLGQTSALVSPGTIAFDFSTTIQFDPEHRYFVGFKDLEGVGVNFKTPAPQDEQALFYASPAGVTGEFRIPKGSISPILQFNISSVPEPVCAMVAAVVLGGLAIRRKRRCLRFR